MLYDSRSNYSSSKETKIKSSNSMDIEVIFERFLSENLKTV